MTHPDNRAADDHPAGTDQVDQTGADTAGVGGLPGDGAEWVDQDQLTRAQKALLALSGDVARQLAEDHGVCVRPLAMRRLDLTSGRVDVVPVPCGSRWADRCPPCADKNRRLRMAQCREGWHLDREPMPKPAEPTQWQKELMAARADLHSAYQDARAEGDEEECDQIREIVAELDADSAVWASAAGSPRSTRTRRGSSAPRGGGRTPRTCPAARSNAARSGRSTGASTGPRPS